MKESKIKIACVENMNNNMFAVMRHLRQRGYNADLICSDEVDHFLPKADTFEETYLSYIKEFDFTKNDILNADKLLINKFFSNYDFIIACGPSIAYLTYAGVKIDIVIPYGSDLYNVPFYEPENAHDPVLDKWRVVLAKNQKKGIENATAVIFDYTSEDFEKVIDKFNFKGTRYKYPCPFIFTPEFNWKKASYLQSVSSFSSKMTAIKNKYEFIAFSHIRQAWKNPPDIWCYKGNERIFRAFREFLDRTGANACLIVFEYGTCIQDSKDLVTELKLDNNVIWFPLMQRRDILTMISYIDVGIGEIGNFSWFSYGAIYEFLCMKKPVIHRRDDKVYIGKVDSFYPMYSAANEEQVTSALIDCYSNKARSEQIAEDAYEWYRINAIDRPIEIIVSEIEKKNFRFYGMKKRANVLLAGLRSIPPFTKNLIKNAIPQKALTYIRNKRSGKRGV
jgi:hypothetical protein